MLYHIRKSMNNQGFKNEVVKPNHNVGGDTKDEISEREEIECGMEKKGCSNFQKDDYNKMKTSLNRSIAQNSGVESECVPSRLKSVASGSESSSIKVNDFQSMDQAVLDTPALPIDPTVPFDVSRDRKNGNENSEQGNGDGRDVNFQFQQITQSTPENSKRLPEEDNFNKKDFKIQHIKKKINDEDRNKEGENKKNDQLPGKEKENGSKLVPQVDDIQDSPQVQNRTGFQSISDALKGISTTPKNGVGYVTCGPNDCSSDDLSLEREDLSEMYHFTMMNTGCSCIRKVIQKSTRTDSIPRKSLVKYRIEDMESRFPRCEVCSQIIFPDDVKRTLFPDSISSVSVSGRVNDIESHLTNNTSLQFYSGSSTTT